MPLAVLVFILYISTYLVPIEALNHSAYVLIGESSIRTYFIDTSKSLKKIPVDVRGRPLDTDGDGVPDYKDKQLLTQQHCFPVDSVGVGVCPEPSCCNKYNFIVDPTPVCNIEPLKIAFKTNSKTLSNEQQNHLSAFAQQLKANPNCKVVIVSGTSTKEDEIQLGSGRVNSIMKVLLEIEGIAEERIVFQYRFGDLNSVELIVYSDGKLPPVPVNKKGEYYKGKGL